MSIIDDTKKQKRGRPPVDTEAINLRLPREMLNAIEACQQTQGDRTRPEAIRRILAEWLKERGYLPK